MDVARFLALICEKKIYFARLPELGDPWEGARSISDSLFSRDPEYKRRILDRFDRRSIVSCWRENEGESVAMWKLYVSGREGVAIKTTVERLGHSLASESRRLRIGRMEYRDVDDTTNPPEVLLLEGGQIAGCEEVHSTEQALFRKNKGYEHEREVRAVISDDYDVIQALWAAGASTLSLGVRRGVAARGEAVSVDLSHLIERIVVSPDFPNWAIGSLQKAVDAACVDVEVKSSRLLDQPATVPYPLRDAV